MKKFRSTHKLSGGTVIRLYKKGFGYCRSEVIENSEYYIALKVSRDFLNSVNDSDKIEAYIGIDDDNIFEFESVVSGKISREPWIIFLEHSDNVIVLNEMKCLKAKTDLPVKFFIIDTHGKKNFHSDNITLSDGKVLEISDREALLSTNADISTGVFLRGHLLEGKEIEILGKVVLSLSNNLYKISFESAGEKERNLILDYVMNIYRE